MNNDQRFCIYPCYINQNYSVSEGRRIPKPAACDNPTTPEIYDCIVQGLKLPADVERKRHPKDWAYLGRVRVQLIDENGKLINPDVPTKRALLIKVAELVPRHPGRSGKTKQPQPSPSGAASSSSTTSGKKGGKKKR